MLDDRSRKVLYAIIQCYINSPGPVGSRVVTKKYDFGLWPATIRNIMADLEEMGYLSRLTRPPAGSLQTADTVSLLIRSVLKGKLPIMP